MAYPALAPAAREFDAGDYPIKKWQSQSGTEIRILYGSKRTGMTLQLSYTNIRDADAQLFIAHYDEVKGSYQTFQLPSQVRAGWTGTGSVVDVVAGAAWRYDQPPSITAVKPGVSTVQVKLKGVLG